MEKPLYQEVIRTLSSRLPREAYRPVPWDLAVLACHFAVCGLGYFVIQRSAHAVVWVTASFVIGHSVFCIGNFAHMLAHQAIVRRAWLRYPLEVVCFSMLAVPASVWRITHNHAHHKHTNAIWDALYQRRFTRDERTWYRSLYLALFFPNRLLPWNPVVLLGLLPGTLINTGLVLTAPDPCAGSPPPGEYGVRSREKWSVAFELAFMVGLQLTLYAIMEGHLVRYLSAGLAPVLIGAGWAMVYISTQHMGLPVTAEHDPLRNSLSLRVPRWLDWLHHNVSHHVEHHLFPGMSARHYPEVRRLLLQHYPAHFRLTTFSGAWRELRASELYAEGCGAAR
jgi:fatty acid desaturase